MENAWAAGIVVIAAAGNDGPYAETITVPGNDPYVITVGAVDGQRTPGYWPDDRIPTWSASGPTLDGFIKPDLVAPGAQIVSFMQNYSSFDPQNAAALVKQHPDYSQTENLFRMNGTSMAAAVTSGAVAVLLQAHPDLTPDQVKYRLMVSARPVGLTTSGQVPNPLQQGAGRLWLPDAVNVAVEGNGNEGMNLQADLAAGWGTLDASGNPVFDLDQLSRHYLGSVRKSLSDDGKYLLYFVESTDGTRIGLGMTGAADNAWLPAEQVAERHCLDDDLPVG